MIILMCMFVCFVFCPLVLFFTLAMPEETDYIVGKVRGGIRFKKPHNSFIKLLSAKEWETLNRIKYNTPILNEYTLTHIERLKSIGLNINLPLYKIEINGHKTLASLSQELSRLRKIEELGYPTNIIITFSENKFFYYNDIIYTVSLFSFDSSIIKTQQTEFVNKDIMFAVNNLNINKPVGTKTALFEGEIEPYCFNISNTTMQLGRERYSNFSYNSSVCNSSTAIIKQRTVSFNYSYEIERIIVSNLTSKKADFVFNSFVDFKTDDKMACYKTALPSKNIIKVCDFSTQQSYNLCSNLNLFSKFNIGKLGAYCSFKYKLEPFENLHIYIVKSAAQAKYPFSILEGEEILNTAKRDYENLQFPVVKSENENLNKLINITLPQKIMSNYIFDSTKGKKDFMSLVNLQSSDTPVAISNLQSVYLKNNDLSQIYFSLLFQYFGISFLKHGLFVNLYKSQIIGGEIKFWRYCESCVSGGQIKQSACTNCLPINIKIKNDGNTPNGFKYNGVEYSNIRFLPYDEIAKSNQLLLQL